VEEEVAAGKGVGDRMAAEVAVIVAVGLMVEGGVAAGEPVQAMSQRPIRPNQARQVVFI